MLPPDRSIGQRADCVRRSPSEAARPSLRADAAAPARSIPCRARAGRLGFAAGEPRSTLPGSGSEAARAPADGDSSARLALPPTGPDQLLPAATGFASPEGVFVPGGGVVRASLERRGCPAGARIRSQSPRASSEDRAPVVEHHPVQCANAPQREVRRERTAPIRTATI